MFCTVLFVFSVVASWVVISAILGTRRVALWLLPVVSFCAAVTGLELLVYQRMIGANLEVIAWFFASLQGIQFLGIAAPLLALRLRGIRLPIG